MKAEHNPLRQDGKIRQPVLTMTIGLPGSGKSTWATNQVLNAPAGSTIRITKDQLRIMLHGGRHHRRNEKQIVAARNELIRRFLKEGVDVIVDDTNLNPVHEIDLRELAGKHHATFQVEDFRHVPVDECVRRDSFRENQVGASVIRNMAKQYKIASLEEIASSADSHHRVTGRYRNDDMSLPEVVIVDIDGTVAVMGKRSPYDWGSVMVDTCNTPVVELVRTLAASGTTIVYLSGRDRSCFDLSRTWLDEHVGVAGDLFMRPEGDNRKDSIVKRELFDTHIRDRFRVKFILDDRDQVVRMWREELGLTCLQVAPGAF